MRQIALTAPVLALILSGCGDTKVVAGYVFNVPVDGDVIAEDMETGTLYSGVSTTVPGTLSAGIQIRPFGAENPKCNGMAQVVAATNSGEGSLGEAKLICNDGRTVHAEFTYESYSRGFGIGHDSVGRSYRFVFGYFADDLKLARALMAEKFDETARLKEEEYRKRKSIKPKDERGA